jgi:glucose-6-phosphate isomerase
MRVDEADLTLDFGPNIMHPPGEIRRLDDVRAMLADPAASGPEQLYTIYMDIYEHGDGEVLREQGLLYGAVVYNHGTVGKEWLRSQGHVHSEKIDVGLRYSEIYEFWTGHGYIYLQKECRPAVSRAFLVRVGPGDRLVIPFGWVHLVINAGAEVMSFGAWCARENTLEYDQLRLLGGPAHFVLTNGRVVKNPRYESVADVQYATPIEFPDLGLPRERPIYTSWRDDPARLAFMARPELVGDPWERL